LKLGKVKYRSDTGGNPSSHVGNAVDLQRHLTTLDRTHLVLGTKQKNILSFELLIQVPLGDYGTDGFYNTAKIGQVKFVKYSIVE